MENMNKRVSLGLPPWHRRPSVDGRSSFGMMAPSRLPLAPSSYQAWKKPFFMSSEGVSIGGTKTYLKPFEGNIMDPLSLDGKSKMAQNPFQPSYKDPIAADIVATATANTDPVQDVQQIRWGRSLDPDMDPKRLKRILSNRVSAQKSRMKKIQYVIDLERKQQALEDEITVLSPRLEFLRNQNKLLQMEKSFLNQELTTSEGKKLLKEAEYEQNTTEVNELRKLHKAQQQQMQGQMTMPGWQYGDGPMGNPSMVQPARAPAQMGYMNSNQGGVEPMMNFNPLNQNSFNGFM